MSSEQASSTSSHGPEAIVSPRTDFLSAIGWMTLGIAILIGSVMMDRLENQDINPYTIPGLLPGLLGIAMTILGTLLAIRSWRASPFRPAETIDTSTARAVRHHDPLMALLSAMAAFIAILSASAFWIASSWPDGYAAPMLAAAGCSLFAAQDDPAVQITGLAKAGMIGSVACAIYLFAILPKATVFEMVVIALGPGLALCALLMTKPKTGIYGLGMVVFGFTLLALQDNYSGDFAAYTNSAIAVIIGLWTAAFSTQLFRSVGAGWTARGGWRSC